MKAPYPCGYIGHGVTRCVVLALPVGKLQRLLPPNLELCDQDVSGPGMHPAIFQFHDFSHCRFSVPSFLPPLNFHEQTFGIPFTRISSQYGVPTPQPSYFMPRLYLDHLWIWTVGRNLWGFNKEMATIKVTRDRYVVASSNGHQLASLSWSYSDESARPAFPENSELKPIRTMLSQTLISLSPAGIGPLLTLTDFERDWSHAAVRPLRAVLDVAPCYTPRFDGGRFVRDARPPDQEFPIIGSYEISAPWWLSFPYLPLG